MAFNRAVVLVDMDCFYVQVEQRRDPDYKGKPCAVVQYKKYRGGGIIAVGYEARARGVTRGMMGDDAKKACPEIHLFRVPESNGKANLDRYREAGAEVINVLSQFGGRVERASIDEAYIDLTDFVNKIIADQKEEEYITREKLPNTHIVGHPKIHTDDADKALLREDGLKEWLETVDSDSLENKRLAVAAAITEEMRAAVFHQTGFRCSAGISHNKMLSKLACGINKPNKQTVLPQKSISILFQTMKIGKVRNLGGKLGKSLAANFNIEFMNQLQEIPAEQLVSAYGLKTSSWLKEVCLGIDHEVVKERHVAQSIGCGKNFLGPDALNTKAKVKKWMDALLIELSERLEKDKDANCRIARSLTVQVRLETGKSLSRSGPLLKYDRLALLDQCLQLIRPLDSTNSLDERWQPAIIQLSVNAKKFDIIGGSIMAHTSHMPSCSKIPPSSGDSCDPKASKIDSKMINSCSGGEMKQIQSSKYWDLTKHKGDSRVEKFERVISEKHAREKIKAVSECCQKNESRAKEDSLAPKENQKGFFFNRAQSDVKHGVKTQQLTAAGDKKIISDEFHKNIIAPSETKFESDPLKFDLWIEDSDNEGTSAGSSSTGIFPGKNKVELMESRKQITEDDVIVVSEGQSKTFETRSPFSLPPHKAEKKKKLCKIDEMLMREKENSFFKTVKNPSNKLPEGPLLHPNYGEIDKEVFKNLPPDIQNEIMNSFKLSSPIKNSLNSKTPTQKQKDSNQGQRLISNFIPQSSSQSPICKASSTKRKSSNLRSGKSKKQRTSSKDKNKNNLSFTPEKDAVPLGFFRQRSQLSNAIAKALTRDSSKFTS